MPDVRKAAAAMDVELLPWPAEERRRRALAAAGMPRLLLVSDTETIPPDVTDCLEDWVRVPTFERDILARTATLTAQAARHGRVTRPTLDAKGILRHGERWTALPYADARIAEALLEHYGTCVTRAELSDRAWPEACPGRNLLDVHVMRLRKRLATVDLELRTIRSRGYLLQRRLAEALT